MTLESFDHVSGLLRSSLVSTAVVQLNIPYSLKIGFIYVSFFFFN